MPVVFTVVPVVLLALFASRLSSTLSSTACLPNGDFVFPGQKSTWDPDLLFTISITFGTESNWSYTHVKVIDIFWDVVVGRGGQLILIYIAYRVFTKSLTYVMESRQVSFETYGAVAFRTAGIALIVPLLRALMDARFPGSWKMRRIFTAFILTTLYISSMPTLFSAMTGYAV